MAPYAHSNQINQFGEKMEVDNIGDGTRSHLLFRKLTPMAVKPTSATESAAGFDLYAIDRTVIPILEFREVNIGIAVKIPTGYYGKISSRSGLAFRNKIFVFDGSIDSDYTGEIRVLVKNEGSMEYIIEPGDRIAQLIIIKHLKVCAIKEVDALPHTRRNDEGFGSSGK